MPDEQDRDIERQEVPQHLRDAADQVGALLVKQVGSIIGAAETRAQEIRGDAEQNQEQIREQTQTAAASVVQRVELIERELSGMLQGLQGLREEASRLAEGMVLPAGDRPAALPASEPAPATAASSAFVTPPPPAEPEPEPEPETAEVVEDDEPPSPEPPPAEEPPSDERAPEPVGAPEGESAPSWSLLAEELADEGRDERRDEEPSATAPGEELMRSIFAPPARGETSWAPPEPGTPGADEPPESAESAESADDAAGADQAPGPEAPVLPPSGFAPPRRRRGLFGRRRNS